MRTLLPLQKCANAHTRLACKRHHAHHLASALGKCCACHNFWWAPRHRGNPAAATKGMQWTPTESQSQNAWWQQPKQPTHSLHDLDPVRQQISLKSPKQLSLMHRRMLNVRCGVVCNTTKHLRRVGSTSKQPHASLQHSSLCLHHCCSCQKPPHTTRRVALQPSNSSQPEKTGNGKGRRCTLKPAAQVLAGQVLDGKSSSGC